MQGKAEIKAPYVGGVSRNLTESKKVIVGKLLTPRINKVQKHKPLTNLVR